jgi:hypothetical protein
MDNERLRVLFVSGATSVINAANEARQSAGD